MTGGAGFIGSHVGDAFLAAGHDVAVVDNLTTGDARWINPRARFHEVDLRSAGLARVFETERPEVVAHLAAQASVGRSVTDPAFDASVNIGGGVALLECCRRYGVRRVIYSSSGGAGYGDPRERPLAMIQSDLEHGYVTARGVVEDYRCEVRSDGSVARPAGLSPSGGRPA